ncbi:MAG TPA: four helix bundle protein [Longimicrobiales bacterium]
MVFDYERLHVYRKATSFLELASALADGFPRKWADTGDQLRRAAMSVALNISEGAGESSRGDKVRFYRIARRSATECAAAISAASALRIIDQKKAKKALSLLSEICAMLTVLILSPRVGVQPPPHSAPPAPHPKPTP